MFETPAVAIVIAAVITGVTTILVALINKFGFDFFKNKKTYKFSANLHIVRRVQNGRIIANQSKPLLIQKLHAATLIRKGRKCSMKARYTLEESDQIIFSGTVRASGVYRNNCAHMMYEIQGEGKEGLGPIVGTALIYVPDWGDIKGHLISPSVYYPGQTVLLTIETQKSAL